MAFNAGGSVATGTLIDVPESSLAAIGTSTAAAAASGSGNNGAGGGAASLDLFKSDGNTDDETVFLEGELTGSGSVSGAPGVTSSAGGGGSAASGPGGAGDLNTLDEPIRDTIWRDVRAVGMKFKHVLYPKERKSLLREWDLWGPLILCTFMATILQSHVEEPAVASGPVDGGGDGGPEFAEVFVIVWAGALVVTLNTKLLGGNISFFQSVCVLGYCLLPLAISLLICRVVLMAGSTANMALFIVRCLASSAGLVWAVYAAMQFLGDCQPQPKRKALAAYPMGLFYFVIAWLVVSHS